jgi:ketopantoate reductase
MRNDGVAIFTRNVNILLGEVSGLLSPRALSIAAAIEKSGVRAAAVSDVSCVEWSKFTAWVGLVVLSVTTRAETWRFLSNPDSARVLVRVVHEMGRLALALGFELTDQAALPVAGICSATESEALELVRSIGGQFARHAPAHRMSSLQDLQAERPLEIHETLGYALQKAQECGLSLPLLAAFYPLVSAIEQTSRSL